MPQIFPHGSIARNLQCSVPDLFRPYSEEKSDHAALIMDALSGLPSDAKDAIVHLVLETSRVLSGKYSNE